MRHARTVASSLKPCTSALPGFSDDAMLTELQEYSLAQAIMRRVEAEAASSGAVAVDRVLLRIGDLSGVDLERLAQAYLTFRNRTICARAPLEITPVRAQWRCGACERPVHAGLPVRCTCGGQPTLSGGDEIVLDRIEMEIA